MDASAQYLLSNFGLQINERIYELLEVEFYWYGPDHQDTYAHRHPEQLLSGYWCFHRATDTPTAAYRNGTFKGLDLALGDGEQYVGVLLRALYHPDTGAITGPCKVVDHILTQYQVTSIVELVKSAEPLTISNNHRRLHLVRLAHPHTDKIHTGPRVGLRESKAPEWHVVPYRFCRRYPLIKKQKRSLKPLVVPMDQVLFPFLQTVIDRV